MIRIFNKFFLITFSFLFVVNCTTSHAPNPDEIKKNTDAVNQFFEKKFQESADRSPETLTFLGSRKKYELLDDESLENYKKDIAISKENLKELQKFNSKYLDAQAQISFKLYKERNEKFIDSENYFWNHYYITQMFGDHTGLVDFMLNYHQIVNEAEAWSYISRLKQFEKRINDLIAIVSEQNKKGVKYPSFVFTYVIQDCKNILKGFPFENIRRESDLYKDFRSKIAKITAESKIKNILMTNVRQALLEKVAPAYRKLIVFLELMEKDHNQVLGVWSQPNGEKYYEHRLKNITTTDLTAKQIYQIGLNRVKEIQQEMLALKPALGLEGDLQDLFKKIKSNPKLFYPNTSKGKAQYVLDAQGIVETMYSKLDQLFTILPKAKLVVKPVEKYREKSAAVAFYEAPLPDGSKPAVYYVNTADMSTVGKYDMEALAYHEGIPGHHMQIAIAQELKDIPEFRKYGGYTVYTEGWALYAEQIPKLVGLYKDPYSEFGRLSMELWRAVRMVVDPGIHYHKWDFNKATSYMRDNTPFSEDKIKKEVERYFVMPGQAVSYMVGQLKIIELKLKAEKALGKKFDIREFHDIILKNGALPLDILESIVDRYINLRK